MHPESLVCLLSTLSLRFAAVLNSMSAPPSYDVVIIGSGFSGSLLGWILSSQGRSVLIIDRQGHPRFAIGESSTPTADFLLAHIADRWNLRTLAPLACWGTWKQRCPEVVCGRKRGFSYYRHFPNQPWSDDVRHSNSLLVAASMTDYWSDTHWLRSSVDQFLCEQAVRSNCELREHRSLDQAVYAPESRLWTLNLTATVDAAAPGERVHCQWLVDASGAGNALAPFVSNPAEDDWMQTRTRAVFGHFTDVAPFLAAASPDDPFCGDDAAQHHVLDHGWCWMLRMDNGITSVGLVEPVQAPWTMQPTRGTASGAFAAASPDSHFQQVVSTYPGLARLLAQAKRVCPTDAQGFMPRLSRCRRHATGPGWVLLPVAYGFVDPLHSSGIAHALSGVLRIADALLSPEKRCVSLLQQYDEDLRQEVEWLDLLVAGCYSALPAFDAFQAFACLYFMAAIRFEQQLAADPGHWPTGFMQCRDSQLGAVVREAFRQLKVQNARQTHTETLRFVQFVRESIAPWNIAGLLDPDKRNRIAHSAAPKYARIATGG